MLVNFCVRRPPPLFLFGEMLQDIYHRKSCPVIATCCRMQSGPFAMRLEKGDRSKHLNCYLDVY